MMHLLGFPESRKTAAVREGAIVKIQLVDYEKDIRGNHCFTILEATALAYNPIKGHVKKVLKTEINTTTQKFETLDSLANASVFKGT